MLSVILFRKDRITSPKTRKDFFNMKKTVRIISLLLVAIMCMALAACGGDTPETTGSNAPATGTQATGTVQTTVEEKEELEIPEEAYYEGYEFRVLGKDNGAYSSVDITPNEALEEDPINEAVYERNNKIEEELGVKIVSVNQSAGAIVNTIKNNVSAQTDAYDLFCVEMSNAFTLARDGCIYNLYEVPYIDLEKSWWDQNVADTMTIKDKLYFTTGDITILDDDMTMVQLFNKDALAEIKPDVDIYQVVKDKKWTLEYLETLIKDMNQDLNGDGKADKDDRWGMCLSTADILTWYNAAGEVMVAPDGEGGFKFAMESTRAIEVMTKSLDFMLDNKFFRTDQLNATSQDELNSFMRGTVVFRSTIMNVARQLRPMEMDFGMLPAPLFDEDQERYYSSTSYAIVGHGIPTTVSDLERTGIITEAMAYYSKQYITPAYYDVSLQGILARDEESREMLDIIFSSKLYDLGYLLNVGGQQRMPRQLVEANSKAFASKYDEVKGVIEDDIASFLEEFEF